MVFEVFQVLYVGVLLMGGTATPTQHDFSCNNRLLMIGMIELLPQASLFPCLSQTFSFSENKNIKTGWFFRLFFLEQAYLSLSRAFRRASAHAGHVSLFVVSRFLVRLGWKLF